MKVRINKLKKRVKSLGLDAVLVTSDSNKHYLSGFTGTNAWLLITYKDNFIISDFRYWEQIKLQAPDFELIKEKASTGGMIGALDRILKKFKTISKIGFEDKNITYSQFKKLNLKLPKLNFFSLNEEIESIRAIKDLREINYIKKAASLADQAFKNVINKITPGVTEKKVAFMLHTELLRLGADKVAFDIIVASGKNSALPHAKSTEKEIKQGEFVIIDFGAVWKGYNSDMTRTLVMGKKIAEKQRRIYKIVEKAQKAALGIIKSGLSCGLVDKKARSIIEKAGFGSKFGHSLGHGVGLDIHERPYLKPDSKEMLSEGMVVTVEPGIYLKGTGGVRIEDLVVITKKGCEIITHSPYCERSE